jgi:hypothetical protein
MSYNLRLPCGCLVYVSCHPKTGVAHTCVIETRAVACRVARHETGLRLFPWEILPEPLDRSRAWWSDTSESLGPHI